jgi:glyoxylase-like metal-dependent hydrolase (beta-lactamase superfamily II)
LIAERVSFNGLLRQRELLLWEADFQAVGNLVTPAFAPVRFDTSFFLAALPPAQHAEVWPGELETGQWATAREVYSRWLTGECLVSPPSLLMLDAIRGCAHSEIPARLGELLRAVNDFATPPIYFSPDVQAIPLRTVALPPSTHTNAYLVGSGPAYLIDPGPADPSEQEVLFKAVEAHRASGKGLTAIVLSHHHPDHIGAAAACARRFSLPVWAHPWTATKLANRVDVTRTIQAGERLELGLRPDGAGPWWLEAVHTPGHAPGHLAFYEPSYQLLFVGDMVSTLSSVVIAPPDGDLAVYLASLHQLRSYRCRLLLPSHGTATARPTETIDECLAHRRKREEMLLAALGRAPKTIGDLARDLYKGVPEHLMRLAEWQVAAGLQKLEQEGRAREVGLDGTRAWSSSAVL